MINHLPVKFEVLGLVLSEFVPLLVVVLVFVVLAKLLMFLLKEEDRLPLSLIVSYSSIGTLMGFAQYLNDVAIAGILPSLLIVTGFAVNMYVKFASDEFTIQDSKATLLGVACGGFMFMISFRYFVLLAG